MSYDDDVCHSAFANANADDDWEGRGGKLRSLSDKLAGLCSPLDKPSGICSSSDKPFGDDGVILSGGDAAKEEEIFLL
eukprot:15356518-Ditylum_brightwellii.AAC.1